ncbi:alpha/beta fold hydrolase [Diaminobutyricimonas sp. LJ205]|uniref:alpha/beta fold hydrolase n=1 Tax=Diaminobutyricimonas sp. LJ205 TaxID=2683590 RepID=UPI0012F4EFA7|nr:alpha/beta hydrolase [Diaminobutyricimonas sp. LJ205]
MSREHPMSHNPTLIEEAPSREDPPTPPRSRRRWRRNLIAAVVIITALVGASTAANLLIEQAERAAVVPYGEKIQIDGGKINVYRAGSGDETIVLLSGLGSAAPAIEFAPLIRELEDRYSVIVVEGFGYGHSDQTNRPRTVENITTELHDTLAQLDLAGPYVLAGHSIAGYYTLYYANQYPDEVSAVIGIDATVPTADAAEAGAGEVSSGINFEKLLQTTGLVRWVTAIAPALSDLDPELYTPTQREQFRGLVNWNYGNNTVADETNRMGQNGHTIYEMRYPRDLPVLNFLASDKMTWNDELHQRNIDLLQNVPHQRIVVLDGDHYLHFTHSGAMAEAITDFLDETR